MSLYSLAATNISYKTFMPHPLGNTLAGMVIPTHTSLL